MREKSRIDRRLILVAALAFVGLGLVAPCATAQGSTAQGSTAAKPWYAGGLEKLGFTVFEKPEAVDDFTVQSLTGSSSTLAEQKGKIVLLNFWATWCPPCRAEMSAIERLWKKEKGWAFTVMGVSIGEDPTKVMDFIGKQGYTYPIFVNPSGALGAAFGARSIPTTYVFDKAGMAIAGKVGGAPYDGAESFAVFAELAAR
jgi:peroxiredoxin